MRLSINQSPVQVMYMREPRRELGFERASNGSIDLYDRVWDSKTSDQPVGTWTHIFRNPSEGGNLEGNVGVTISRFFTKHFKEMDKGPSQDLLDKDTSPYFGFHVMSGEQTIEIIYAARNLKTGKVLEGETFANMPEHWLSG
jgi:hypothetical protein